MLGMSSFSVAAAAEQKTGAMDTRSISVVAAAMVCSFLPLSASHLISLMVGALLFFAFQVMSPTVDRDCAGARKEKLDRVRRVSKGSVARGARTSLPTAGSPSNNNSARVAEKTLVAAGAASPSRAEVWKPSVVPVLAPTFTAQGWEAEVQELLSQLTPTSETNEVVAKIAQVVKGMVTQVLPGAEVTGFVGASLSSGKAFGVAVPEVDIVVSATSDAMIGRLSGRWQQGKPVGAAETNAQKLRKSAVRACTDRLVTEGGFKFRRSAFRGEEPKVTIVSPQALQSVPMNLSVNAITPLCNAVLIEECARMDPRTHGLILLVKRWAKDRGLCHVARGHLSLYSWTVLSIFFLQVGADGAIPALEGLQTPDGLAVKCRSGEPASARPATAPGAQSVGALLKAFFSFYSSEFHWRKEAVSVRSGRHGRPAPRFPPHIIFGEDGKTTEVGPSIEDPFDVTSNLGACTTSASLQHLHKEFRRAHELCCKGASLTELLQPWAPEMPEDGSED